METSKRNASRQTTATRVTSDHDSIGCESFREQELICGNTIVEASRIFVFWTETIVYAQQTALACFGEVCGQLTVAVR